MNITSTSTAPPAYGQSISSAPTAERGVSGNREPVENVGSVLQPVEQITATAAANGYTTQADTASGSSARDEKQALEARQQRQVELLEQREIQQLAARDREVRAHEQAHAAVGGQYAGAPRYEYQRGPDGINYAVGGEVSISAGPVNGDPQATIEKAQIVRRAALAPAEPSPQDRKVAAQATQMEASARAELVAERQQERIEQTENQAGDSEPAIATDVAVNNNINTNTAGVDTDNTASPTSNNGNSNAAVTEPRAVSDLNRIISSTAADPQPGSIISSFA